MVNFQSLNDFVWAIHSSEYRCMVCLGFRPQNTKQFRPICSKKQNNRRHYNHRFALPKTHKQRQQVCVNQSLQGLVVVKKTPPKTTKCFYQSLQVYVLSRKQTQNNKTNNPFGSSLGGHPQVHSRRGAAMV